MAHPWVDGVAWPLWSIFPASFCFWWLFYLCVTPALGRLCATEELSKLNQLCWRQNVTSLLHTLVVVSVLVVVFATDATLRRTGVAPYYNALAYADVCVSLGYMCFALPWSLHMRFVLGARRPYVTDEFTLHHCCVVTAEVVYLLSNACPFYGAIALMLMEFTNWLYLPYVLMKQHGHDGPAFHVCGVGLVVSFVVCRLGVCTWVGVAFAQDAASGMPDGLASAVVLSLLAYWTLQCISYWWFAHDVLPQMHATLLRLGGDEYYLRPLPRPLRVRLSPTARAKARQRREMQELARQMRLENEAYTSGTKTTTLATKSWTLSVKPGFATDFAAGVSGPGFGLGSDLSPG